MEEKNMVVPYIVYEGSQARHERTIKRLVIIIIIAISMLFATNAIWIYMWSQYDTVVDYDYDYSQNGRGINIIGDGNGVDQYGSEIENQNPSEDEIEAEKR